MRRERASERAREKERGRQTDRQMMMMISCLSQFPKLYKSMRLTIHPLKHSIIFTTKTHTHTHTHTHTQHTHTHTHAHARTHALADIKSYA